MNPALIVGLTISGLGVFFILLSYFFHWYDRRKDLASDIVCGLGAVAGAALVLVGVIVFCVSALIIVSVS